MAQQDISSDSTDDLSPFAREVLAIDLPTAYLRLVPSGDGNAKARELLEGATHELMLGCVVQRKEDAMAMLSGLWLWHDWLDRSHTISQGISSPTGSFWHAIMHRREGDFSNSKYWYARCRDHPVLQTLGHGAAPLINPHAADKSLLRLVAGQWNPEALVDLVEAVHGNPGDPRHALAVSLQQLEWRVLFDHCTCSAAGK